MVQQFHHLNAQPCTHLITLYRIAVLGVALVAYFHGVSFRSDCLMTLAIGGVSDVAPSLLLDHLCPEGYSNPGLDCCSLPPVQTCTCFGNLTNIAFVWPRRLIRPPCIGCLAVRVVNVGRFGGPRPRPPC